MSASVDKTKQLKELVRKTPLVERLKRAGEMIAVMRSEVQAKVIQIDANQRAPDATGAITAALTAESSRLLPTPVVARWAIDKGSVDTAQKGYKELFQISGV